MKNLEELIGGELEEAVAPNHLIVGVKGDMAYFTFVNKKGSKVVINSEKSWRNWSENADNPIIIKNKFLKGYKIGEVNERFSSQSRNMEVMTLVHPEVNKRFEISLKRFVELANKCNINKGVLDIELLMGKHDEVFTREEYENEVKRYKEKLLEMKRKEEEQKSLKKVPPKDQVPGRIYKDIKNGRNYLYLGTCDFICKGKVTKKHVYRLADFSSKFVKGTSYDSKGNGRSLPIHCSLDKYMNDTVYRVDHSKTFASKTRKQLTESSIKENMFEGLSDEDWSNIYKAFKNVKDDNWGQTWHKLSEDCEIRPNFREEYLEKVGENKNG